MKNNNLVLVLIIAVLALASCTQNSQEQSQDSVEGQERLDVIVSILPQVTFVESVGQENVDVKALIPPGASPSTYEPKPSDLASVEEADIYFRIGHIDFEKSHAGKFAELNPDMKVVDTSENVKLREFGAHEAHSHEHEDEHMDEEHSDEHEHEDEHVDEEHGDHDHSGTDPHIWLSPLQVKTQVDSITLALASKDPANAQTYLANAEAFKAELDDLHEDIEAEFAELRTDKLMVFHPAWGYFADEYGLKQIAIEQDGKEPTAQELLALIDQAREEEIKVIFVQSQFNKNIAESIASEIGAVVVSIDPLSEDYITNLRGVATTIASSLA